MPRCCNFDGGLGLVWCYGHVRGLPDLFLLGFINCVTQQNHYNEIRCLKQRQVRDLSLSSCNSFTVKRVELDSARKMPNRAAVNLIFVWVFVRLQVKYVGDDGEEQNGLQMTGLNLMDKTMAVRGARIAYSIWDVAGKNLKFHEAATLFPGCFGPNARFPTTSPDHFSVLWKGCRRHPIRRPHPNRVQGRRGDPIHVRSHEPVHA